MLNKVKSLGFISILPLLVFVFTFLGAGIATGDFYALPSPIAALLGIVTAFLLFSGTITEKADTLLKGCGDGNILTMCIIYLLAGAFASVCKAAGSVDSVVNLGITYIAPEYFAAGVFVMASFLSFASGTSVGSIVTLGSIVIELAIQSGSPLGIIGAALLCGAMFGDNLSIISDTTIASTQSIGAEMKDKFRANFKLALPAAILATAIFVFLGLSSGKGTLPSANLDFDLWLILPYLIVIVLALRGVNVFATLFIGLISAGILGLFNGSFTLLTLAKTTYTGFTDMSEIFFLSLLTGGLAALVEKAGGIKYILSGVRKKINSKRTAYLGMAGIVSATNLCVANNTIAILISGKVAKNITDEYGLDKKNAASVLDIFACYIQGIIPYGAQVLILISLSKFKIEYLELLAHSYYLHFLVLITLGFVLYNGRKKKSHLRIVK